MAEEIPYPSAAPFGTSEFADNPEPRCPCVLVLDTSGSMRGQPITELNAGLVTFKDELVADSLASLRVEVAIVTFGPVEVAQDFVGAGAFQPPTLTASGDTPMGAAVERALDLLSARRRLYETSGVKYYKPWVFLVTDGAPTDSWQQVATVSRAEDARGRLAFFAVGVEGARHDVLMEFSARQPMKLDGLRFRDLFVWLSSSMKAVSRSRPGEEVPLDNPAKPGGWGRV